MGRRSGRAIDASLLALGSTNSAQRHLPALGNLGGHELLHEQCFSKGDIIAEGRLRTSLDSQLCARSG
ncbi:hypothetical protein JHN63_37065 [Streptomyces sp. MBT65]|uniref:hypothetical protein n=1 Tax=Streptomyces sp. MBT65 TaxID=1488395 RepID=UPI00190C2827|nr:hypothetical protein [Streptomyces sp. MBT65]MBK3579316.1 hypothetical protein [Streptomyces sp. MBT65]